MREKRKNLWLVIALMLAIPVASVVPILAATLKKPAVTAPNPPPVPTPTPVPAAPASPAMKAVPAAAPDCAGLAVWSGNSKAYSVGQQVVYGTEAYSCIQAHTSEANWMPPATPALWKDLGACSGIVPTPVSTFVNCASLPLWSSNGSLYTVGELVYYSPNNSVYKALVAVYGYAVYAPPAVPNVWQFVSVCATPTPTFTPTATFTFIPTSTPTPIVVSCGNAPHPYTLAVPLYGQQNSNWCWAASSSMAAKFVGNVDITQCQQASVGTTPTANCCTINLCPNPDQSLPCNHGGFPDVTSYGFTDSQTADGTALTFHQLIEQMYCDGKPVIFSWHWTGGGGHAMVAIGYDETPDGIQWVNVNDPEPVCGGTNTLYAYQWYVGDTSFGHTHWFDYYNITK